MNFNILKNQIFRWIRKKVENAGLKGVVIGASGGVDSSVTIKLAKQAFPENILCLIMPCGNSSEDEEDAKLLLKRNDISYKIINFENLFNEFQEKLKEKNYKSNLEDVVDYSKKLALANTKARMRMMFLYYYSQINNYMVLGTGNRTELEIGYFTKYGDGAADILPLAGLFKREVVELAKIINVPEKILAKTPSGGLWKNQTDEGEIGLSYDELEFGIRKYYNLNSEVELELKQDINYIIKKTSDLIEKNKHKRKLPPKFKVERND